MTRPVSAPFAALALPLAGLAVPDGSSQQPVVLIPDGQFQASDGRPMFEIAVSTITN